MFYITVHFSKMFLLVICFGLVFIQSGTGMLFWNQLSKGNYKRAARRENQHTLELPAFATSIAPVLAEDGRIPNWLISGHLPAAQQHNPHPGPNQHNSHPASNQRIPHPASNQRIPQPGSNQHNPHPGPNQHNPHPGSSQHNPRPGSSQRNPQPGSSPTAHRGPPGIPRVEIPKGLPKRYNHKYESWWKEFHSDLQGCGKQQTPPRNPFLRVIGGHLTTTDSFPWMVSMFSTLINQPWCAGTLIAPQWVVTAAHCFRGPFSLPSTWTLHVGKNNASGFAEYEDEQVRSILELRKHPGFNDVAVDFQFDNDIALIKLDQAVVLNKHASPLCLVRDSDHVTDRVNSNTRCTITGYGISNTKDVRRELNALHVADVPLIGQKTCSLVSEYRNQVTDNMICAGREAGGVDSCNGDSGGPLQCQIDGTWYHVGITSWGADKCAEPRKPGVYTDVSKYTDWIYTQIFNDYTG